MGKIALLVNYIPLKIFTSGNESALHYFFQNAVLILLQGINLNLPIPCHLAPVRIQLCGMQHKGTAHQI